MFYTNNNKRKISFTLVDNDSRDGWNPCAIALTVGFCPFIFDSCNFRSIIRFFSIIFDE